MQENQDRDQVGEISYVPLLACASSRDEAHWAMRRLIALRWIAVNLKRTQEPEDVHGDGGVVLQWVNAGIVV